VRVRGEGAVSRCTRSKETKPSSRRWITKALPGPLCFVERKEKTTTTHLAALLLARARSC
jgi:hypothetical protein